MTHAPSVISIQVGRPQSLGLAAASEPFDMPWTTGIFKTAVAGPVFVGLTNLAGDEQADLTVHGGVDKAVCVYSAEHYDSWRAALDRTPFDYGAFGENLTVGGITEDDVCIGDTWSAGEVLLQLSQPRQPCWKVARKWRVKDLAEQIVANGRTGWYFRVLKEGTLEPGAALTLVVRPHPEWTVTAANEVMHHRKKDRSAAAALGAVTLLSKSWKATLGRRARG